MNCQYLCTQRKHLLLHNISNNIITIIIIIIIIIIMKDEIYLMICPKGLHEHIT